MLFILDAQSYMPVKLCKVARSIHLCKVARSIHLFKLMGKLIPGSITLKRNCVWDVLDIDWKEVGVTLNGNKINLPSPVTIPFRDKFGIRSLLLKSPVLTCNVEARGDLVYFRE